MSTIILYGISNCDTIKKAKAWLKDHGIDFVFHDYRKHGLAFGRLEELVDSLGWEAILNRRGTTWRALPDETRNNINRDNAIEAMLENPALIKRPILALNGKLHVGFSDQQYQEIFT